MMNDLFPTHEQERCPRCGTERLRAWNELDEQQCELVRRLPASADYSHDERVTRHRWCTRCWHEETGDGPRLA